MINYTPHTVTVRDASCVDHVYPASGIVPRVELTSIPMPPLEDGTPVIAVEYGDAQLPSEHSGPCIVSTMFADALIDHIEQMPDDELLALVESGLEIYVPDVGPSAIRENGQIVAVRALILRWPQQ